MKWKKVTKITNQYVPWRCFYSLINVTFSWPCAHHDGIWERGGTKQHITNPVLLQTVPSDNILATFWSVNLPFFPNFISYQNRWPLHTLHILVSLFYGLMDFIINYPHSLALRGTLALYECVVSLTLHLHCPCGKYWVPTELEAVWARDLA